MPLLYHVPDEPSDLTPRRGYVAIYGLFDPRDGRLRYIGKAANPRFRLTKHRNPDGIAKEFTVGRWVLHLKSLGLDPVMVVFDWVGKDEWADVERAYIAQARADGIDLANLSPGGDGSQGAGHGPEARAKVSAAQKGRKRAPETRAKISENLHGRAVSPETRAKMRASRLAYLQTPEGQADLHKAVEGRKRQAALKRTARGRRALLDGRKSP